tara:strand:+ start:5154 stop:5519 length:366 start_codon:yes stop_codon:yes gene_type:complete
MNVKGLLQFHLAFCYRAYKLMEAKNHDYAGAGGEEPFRNFKAPEALGIATTEQALLVRMVDKINRLVTFCRDGKLEVTNETAQDALLDLMNYTIILGGYMQDKAPADAETEPVPDAEVSDA